ncbi:hypothetical protein MW887_008856 [Aspergillus wentii]|nr:hypothetical protein MW887_008856 [Aspergillus wentii]
MAPADSLNVPKPPFPTMSPNLSQQHGDHLKLQSDDVNAARESLWQSAYQQFVKEEPELAKAYEMLLKNDSGLSPSTSLITSEGMFAVADHQKSRMENKQWMYSWFGKPKKVRDTAESILTVVQQASGLISAGMTMAPIYVSLPWSMVSALIPFIMSDINAVHDAVNGLKEVTSILNSYSYAETIFLSHAITGSDFKNAVISLYGAIFKYQASAACYFAKKTLKRMGCNVLSSSSWTNSIADIERLERRAAVQIQALGVRLSQAGFADIRADLKNGLAIMERIQLQFSTERRQRERIQEWLSPINHHRVHAGIQSLLGDEYVASGQWLWQDSTSFEPWIRSSKDTLLLQGVVGSGKTSLSSILIHHLLAHPEMGQVAFFYFSDNVASPDGSRAIRNDLSTIFLSILAQCCLLPDGTISKAVHCAFDDSEKQAPGGCDLSLGAILNLLETVFLERPEDQFTFIFDALDECGDRQGFLSSLTQILRSRPKVRLFISSRFGIDISDHLKSYHTLSISSHSSTDIRSYVENEVKSRYASSGMNEKQATRLKDALNLYSDGVFRWVVLELDIFLPRSPRQGSRQMPRDIENRLERLEHSHAPAVERLFGAYQELYEYALGAEDEHSRRHVVKTAITRVLCSFTRVTQYDLLHAVSVQPDGSIDMTIQLEVILDYCSNFLVKEPSGIIKLAHLSVRQFFERMPEFAPPQQHLRVASYCLQVVQSLSVEGDIQLHRSQRPGTRDFSRLRSSLVIPKALVDLKAVDTATIYSYLYWSAHCRATLGSVKLSESHWAGGVRDVLVEDLTPLHSMIAAGRDFSTRDVLGNTKLHEVVQQNQLAELDLLLRLDSLQGQSQLNVENKAGNLPIHLAAMRGFRDAFHDLALAGSRLDATNSYGLTPLQLAIIFGRVEILQLACRIGIDIYQPDRFGNCLLHCASFISRTDIVHVLLKAGACPDVPNQAGDTPFFEPLKWANVTTNIRNKIGGVAADEFLKHSREPATDDRRKARGYSLKFRHQADQPKVCIDDAEISSCRFCNLQTWLEGSQEGLQYDLSSSDEELADMDANGCKLCQLLIKELSSARLSKTSEVKVRVALESGRDILALSYAGSEIELEFCINSEGSEKPTPRILEYDELGKCVKKFVFFSFTWGGELPFKTTQDNLKSYKKGIALDSLPRLFQDAIELCRSIGYRFIWIDALCIISDQPEDSDREIARVNEYIQSADLVMATTGFGVYGSLAPAREPSVALSIDAHLERCAESNHQPFTLHLRRPVQTARHAMEKGILHRSWRVQEVLLARRIAIFGPTQLYWSCLEALKSEANTFEIEPWFQAVPAFRYWLDDPGMRALTISSRTRILHYWYSVVEMFSRGNVTFQPHRLSAVDAVARNVRGLMVEFLGHEDEYNAGIWQSDMCHGLLWVDSSNGPSLRYLFPSWSWVSAQDEISYCLASGLKATLVSPPALFSVEQCKALSSPSLSQVENTIHISSLSRIVEEPTVESTQKYEFFFDFVEDEARSDCVRLRGIVLVIVAPWAFRPGSEYYHSRWAGLMLKRMENDSTDKYVRDGVFLGECCDESLEGWERKSFSII